MKQDEFDDLFARIAAFEWDEEKRGRNLRDHNVDFDDARRVFDGPTFVRRSDRKDEVRFMVFGFLDGDETVIVCTFRSLNCRLISARRARRDERKKYYGSLPRRSEAGED